MSVLQQWQAAQASPEVVVNENFAALEHVAVYSKNPATSSGLTWGYLGGRWAGLAVSSGTLTLTASATNYVVVERSTGVASVSIAATNWNNTASYARVCKLTTGADTVTAEESWHVGGYGVLGQDAASNGAVASVIAVTTANRSVALSDVQNYLRFTAAGAKSASFDEAVGFAPGNEVHITNRAAAGNLTLSGVDITLNAPKNGTLVLEPGDVVTVKFVSSTEADVFGGTQGAT